MLTMNCPHCNKQLSIPEKFAGQKGKCNFCGKPITAPGEVPRQFTVGPPAVSGDDLQSTDLASLNIDLDGLKPKPSAYVEETPKPRVNFTTLGVRMIACGCLMPFLGFALIVFLALISSVGPGKSGEQTVAPATSPAPAPTVDPVALVRSSQTVRSWPVSEFKTAALAGGTAVLVANAAYWVKDGQAYIANGFAKTYSPELPYSPQHVGFSEVEAAILGKPNAPSATPPRQSMPSTRTPQPRQQQEKTVYITTTGQKYHTKTCRTMKQGITPVSLSNAAARGYVACMVCNP